MEKIILISFLLMATIAQAAHVKVTLQTFPHYGQAHHHTLVISSTPEPSSIVVDKISLPKTLILSQRKILKNLISSISPSHPRNCGGGRFIQKLEFSHQKKIEVRGCLNDSHFISYMNQLQQLVPWKM